MAKRNIYRIVGTITALSQVCLLLMLVMTASAATAAEKEKIKIEQFSLNRSVAYLGEEISASVTVSATPSLRKEELRVRYYLDKKEIGKQIITSFSPAGIAKTDFSFKDSPEGRYQFRVIVDIEGKTEKSDEVSRQLAILSLPGGMTNEQFSSNSDDKTSKKDPASQKPDLEPLSIDFNIASPRLGQKVRILSRISNTGSVQADNAKIRLFINGQPYGDDITMNIAAGSQANIETDFLPKSEGKKDILLLINPDGEIDEKSNRNNLLSKTLIVRPAGKTSKRKKTAKAPEKSSSQTDRANLVVYIETISGVHYTGDGQVRFYITNNSQTTQSKPFTLGVQLLQASQSNLWLIRQPVKALKAGETVTVSTRWPEDQLSTASLFLAMVDIEGKIKETDIRDNHTRPFRVVSTAANSSLLSATGSELEPEIIINHPANNEHLLDSNKLVVNWETHGDIGNRVRISVSRSKTKEKILSSITNNDGQYSIDFSSQKAGEYTLLISTENNDVASSKRTFKISQKEPAKIPRLLAPVSGASSKSTFKISQKEPAKIPRLLAPVSGASFRGEQEMKITWPESFKKRPGLLLNFVLLESSSKRIVKLNDKPVAAKEGQYSWQVPDDGSVFGIYTLQTISLDGKVLAATNGLEILPNFVNFDPPEINSTKDEIKTDVEIARTSFNGPNLEILVMNNGPAEITPSGMVGYKFTTYFVRNIPIVKEEDLVICTSSLLAELPEGEGQVISLGRDPDCPLGERGSGGRFVYAVSRFTLPILVNQLVKDPKPHNNLSKFYWPDN